MNKVLLIACCIALTLATLFTIYQIRSIEAPIKSNPERLIENAKPVASQIIVDQPQIKPPVETHLTQAQINTRPPEPEEIAHANDHENDINLLLSFFDEPFTLNDSSITGIKIFLSRLPDDLEENQLQSILKQIDAQLPDAIEPDIGQIISRLYDLRAAENKLMHSSPPPSNPEELHSLNQGLESLRLNMLGPSLKKHFYPVDPNDLSIIRPEEPAHLINKLSLEGLSDQEIEAQLAEKFGELSAHTLRQLKAIENTWFERYLLFLADKQIILDAGISDEDKSEQIEVLLKRHYTQHELKGARAFDKLMSEPDTP